MTSAATVAAYYDTGLPGIEVVKLTSPDKTGSYYYSRKFQTVKAVIFSYAGTITDTAHTYYTYAISGNRITLIQDDATAGTAGDIWLLVMGQ